MPQFTLTQPQLSLVEHPLDAKIFLEGPAGAGKTTAGVERLLGLLEAGVRADSVLLIVPQRTLAAPYYAAVRSPNFAAGGLVSILTVGGLAQRMIDLFWPMVAETAGFSWPDELPTFLTLETAQYYMAHLVQPLLSEGLFESVSIDRNRLYSQIIDNLNKAAVVGFPYMEIGERLTAAGGDEPGQKRVYQDVQTCASLFRDFCLGHNLLDFSLQVEVFWEHLWVNPACRDYLLGTYRHLLVDNLEEDTPVAHDLLREWLPFCDSALLIYDREAGYRRFLGADPQSAYQLRELCSDVMAFEESFVTSPAIASLEYHLAKALHVGHPYIANHTLPERQSTTSTRNAENKNLHPVMHFETRRYYPQMLDWVADQIASLVFEEGVLPAEIVVLAPFLSDALRFTLMKRVEAYQIPVRSHRPSRSLRDEPITQCLLTLTALAHPEWGVGMTKFDVAYSLVQAIAGLDLVRAQLLAEIVYRVRDGVPNLSSFDQIRPEMQERITYRLGERYEELRLWLGHAGDVGDEFDHFLSRLFGEVLSQPGFGFHANYNAGEVTANLIESVQKFRWVAGRTLAEEGELLGKEYLTMVQDGVIAAQYIRSWQVGPDEAVLLAPAYTFLMSNRPVKVQFWLDVGSRGWSERLYQPLTHPYVLSRAWPRGKPWRDVDEVETSRDALYRLALGLLRRCRQKIYLGLSELGEGGYEQRGPLLQAFQRVLRETHPPMTNL